MSSSEADMDAQFQGLIWTLGLDFAFFVICYLIFRSKTGGKNLTYSDEEEHGLLSPRGRNLRPEDVNLRGADDDQEDASKLLDKEEEEPEYRWWTRWFGMPLRNNAGYLYIRWHQITMLGFLAMSLVAVPILLPVYITGDNRIVHGTWLQLSSAGNVPLASPKLWIVFAMVLFITIVAYYCITAFLTNVRRRFTLSSMKLRHFRLQQTRKARAIELYSAKTVHLQGLSVRCFYGEELLEYFNARFPDQVEFVHIAKDLTSLAELNKQRQEVEDHIERCIFEESKTGKRIKHGGCCGCCDTVDSLRYYENLKERLTMQIETAQREKHLGTGHAFVVFKHPPDLASLYESEVDATGGINVLDCFGLFKSRDGRELNVKEWTYTMAPPPADILWDNLPVTKAQQTIRYLLFNFALFVLMVIIIAPVSVLDRITPLLKSVEDSIAENERDPYRVLITNYAPPLVIFLINSLLLPWLIDIVSHLECHHLESQRLSSVFHKNLFFMFMNVIVIPTLALNSISAFLHLSYNTKWRQWNQIIGHVFLSSSGHFFIQYVIHAAFLGGGAQLLDLGQWIWRSWKLRSAMTEAKLAEANEIWDFDFGYWYSARLTVFGVVIVYSVVVPIILPIGFIYFWLQELVDRRNFLEGVYKLRWQSHGILAVKVARYMLLYLALFLFVMASFFMVQGTQDLFALGGLLSVIMCSTVFVYFTQTFVSPLIEIEANIREAAKQQGRQDPDEESSVDPSLFKLYVHPLSRDDLREDGSSYNGPG